LCIKIGLPTYFELGSYPPMNLLFTTEVEAPLAQVKAGFTQELFLALSPPFPRARLLAFGGCKTGDRVALQLDFGFFKLDWESLITDHSCSSGEWSFVDEGVRLPFFLKSWTHRHVVIEKDQGSLIIDDIEYASGNKVMTLLNYPLLWLMFWYRKPIYKRWFKK
jgi:ligand-binding SRPBCC domain-containing protein